MQGNHAACLNDMCVDQVSKADRIKAEIWRRGPVACGIFVTPAFAQYMSGIFSQDVPVFMPNHELSLVGYGISNGTE